jgi:hypothetical protein
MACGELVEKAENDSPFTHVTCARFIGSQSVVKARLLRNNDEVVLTVRAVGTAVAKEATLTISACHSRPYINLE